MRQALPQCAGTQERGGRQAIQVNGGKEHPVESVKMNKETLI